MSARLLLLFSATVTYRRDGCWDKSGCRGGVGVEHCQKYRQDGVAIAFDKLPAGGSSSMFCGTSNKNHYSSYYWKFVEVFQDVLENGMYS